MTRFVGKVAIVTGSSNGIGRATAILLASEGAKVTISGRNSERVEETRQFILKAGVPESHVNCVVGDVTLEAIQNELVDSTIKKFGRLDILVNNAGGAFSDTNHQIGVDQPVLDYDKTFDLNIRSILTLVQKAKPHLAATKGEIVNVSSVFGTPHANVEFIYYAMTKSALDQFTRCAAIDLIKDGIRVNSVSPGYVSTGIFETAGLTKKMELKFIEYMTTHKECIPAGVIGKPEDIAKLIAFLAHRESSSYIIGQSIVIDGGSTLVIGMSAHDVATVLKD